MEDKEQKLEKFAKSYEDLERHMCAIEANKQDMDGWFYPGIKELIEEYGEEIAVQYGQQNYREGTYHIGYLARAGLKAFNKTFLLSLTETGDELEVYEAALALAICGYEEGFQIFRAFALHFHPLYTGWITPGDMIEDLEYIANDERATSIIGEIKDSFPFVFSKDEDLEKSHALHLLKEELEETDRPDSDFEIRLAKYALFFMIKPKSYKDYWTGIGGWLINRATRETIAVSSQVEPDIWSEIHRETKDPNYGSTIRFDPVDKKSLIQLKNLLQVPLSVAKSIADRPHWFGGHSIQLADIREKLKTHGIQTLQGFTRFDGSIKRLRIIPHEGYFIEDIIQFIKNEPSHFWEE